MRTRLLILIIFIFPSFHFSQYWGERVTEKSFEQSDLYFRSHFLNTFGMNRFEEVAVGLVRDPFLELALNPANLPDLRTNHHVYLDFRGDRTRSKVLDVYPIEPLYHLSVRMPYNYFDPRWYVQTRDEPEPVFSIGYLTYPLANKTQKFFTGATYQFIYNQEPYYSMPSWIYSVRYGYDAFGTRVAENSDIPVQDRYIGQDETVIEGHLFNFYLGSRLSGRLITGLSISGVIHARDGNYLNSVSNEYGETQNYDWSHLNRLKRKQDYHHAEISVGLNYTSPSGFIVGLKAGFLDGTVNQSYRSQYASEYEYEQRSHFSMNQSETVQSWDHDGENIYGNIHFTSKVGQKNEIRLFYRYSQSDIALRNKTEIQDTSFYASEWFYNDILYEYENRSSLSDRRTAAGNRDIHFHQFMFNSQLRLTDKTTATIGLYLSWRKSIIHSREPVKAERFSRYYRDGTDYYEEERFLFEDKTLIWNYRATKRSFQIPLLFDFRLSSVWTITLGINRILYSWKMEDKTIAYFKIRRRTTNDSTVSETNFAERYQEPTQKMTEDFTDIIGKFSVAIAPGFRIHLLLDPEFRDNFRIAQWWLGFTASL